MYEMSKMQSHHVKAHGNNQVEVVALHLINDIMRILI